jgi:hypothetical protein
MDDAHFDALTRRLHDVVNRRGVLRAARVTIASLAAALTLGSVDAKKRKRHKRRKRRRATNQPPPSTAVAGSSSVLEQPGALWSEMCDRCLLP